MDKTRRELIEADLKIFTRITGGQMVHGMLVDIGNKYGITRERVRQIANEMGLIPARQILKEKRVCVFCGEEYLPKHPGQKYCSRECSDKIRLYKYWELVICKMCGFGYIRYKNKMTNSNKFYCGRRCLGKWLAKEHGWGSKRHKERMAEERANEQKTLAKKRAK